jgi:hypothetical protein
MIKELPLPYLISSLLLLLLVLQVMLLLLQRQPAYAKAQPVRLALLLLQALLVDLLLCITQMLDSP